MSIKSRVSTFYSLFLRSAFNRIVRSPIGNRLAKGAFWSMAAAVISRGLMLGATILVARILGKTVYGELGIIQSTVAMFSVFAGFSLGLTATKHVAEFRQSDPKRAGRIIGLSGLFTLVTASLMALGLFIFAPWIAEHTINAPHLSGVLRISTLILFISAINGVQIGTLVGFEAFKTIAYVNLYVGLVSFPMFVCGAYFFGLTGAVWALAINLCIFALINQVALHKEVRNYQVPISFRDCNREWRILWKFSIPAVLAGVVVGPVNWICRALLTTQPNGYDEMGILTAAIVFQVLLLSVDRILTAPLLPMLSNEGPKKSEKLGTVNILSSWILGAMASIPLLCFPEIAQILFGNDYDTQGFKVTLSLVVFCTSTLMFKSGLARFMVANSLLWLGFFSNLLWAIIFISSTFFLVHWGAPGLAVSLSFAYILQTVIILPICYARKLIPKGTFFSRESALIWFVLVSLVLLNIANISLIFRSIAFVPSILFAGFAFIRMGKKCFVTTPKNPSLSNF